ncbi:MAG: hypothetical protein A2Y53_00055 [Chloroflexi bacterium RBG_16_47_49]|nr:MAG: hypothetical protein A2Y53_00055 [Chloroflexi bacterium RBG_16_47_49]
MKDYMVISEEELRDADEMLSATPDIEIHQPTSTILGYRGKLLERDDDPWIKLSIKFRTNWMRTLKGCKLPVFLAIALHINKDGQCYPNIETIADETGYSQRQVIRAVQELTRLGLLEVNKVFIDQIHRKNIYTVKAMVAYGQENPKSDIIAPLGNMSEMSPLIVTNPVLEMSLKEDSLRRTIKSTPNSSPAKEVTYEPIEDTLKKIPNKDIMAMASAIADVAHADFIANISSLKQEAKLILQNPTVSPELIRSLYRKEGGKWYNNWRTSPPSIRQIKSTWLSLMEPEEYNSNTRIYREE